MTETIENTRVDSLRPLLSPVILHEELPLSESALQTVVESRKQITDIISGNDKRLLVVVGPCSVRDTQAAIEYSQLLKQAAEQYSDDLFFVMRVYFEKPRTVVGWKGLIHDPHLDNSFDMNHGLRIARKLLLDILDVGVATGTEFLDSIIPQFISDAVTWGAIGARTAESQLHRELASGLSMPVGFKNGTDGDVQIAIDAVSAAKHPHHFLSITKQGIPAIINTIGNDACHIILRGGKTTTNYDADSIHAIEEALKDKDIHQRILVDCSHGNCSKDYKRQGIVAESVAEQIKAGNKNICGIMLESSLLEGRQKVIPGKPLVYGQSITDACLSWPQTQAVLDNFVKNSFA